MSSALVSIAGAKSTVTVDLQEGETVIGALQSALRTLGLPETAAANLEPVVNGEDAKLSDRVPDGSVVTGAGRVSNG